MVKTNILYFFKTAIKKNSFLDTRVSDYAVESSSNQHYYNTVTNTLSSQRSANLVTPSMSGNLIFLIKISFLFLHSYKILLFF